MSNGPLTLSARLCLLAWDAAGPAAGATAHRPAPVRAGALVELARRGLLTDEDGIATPVDLDASAGDAVLDGLLELVRESRPHPWRTWVTLRARVTFDAVREQLVADGFLRAEKRRVLGVFPTVEYALERVAVVEALREETRQILHGALPVARISERDAALAVLTAAADLLDEDTPDRRIEQLTERAGASMPPLASIVREVSTAVTARRAVAASP
ncbi:Golgi phosphoprotein 3 (GPP34) [Streptomyces sp. Ag82_O1-12]|uniref:GOLPH3/VPS74 family protein n=1 Tax=unclassified Streptomyces TaxID=2593676 RepID=UPI000BD3A454|nr:MULTISPECIES: GPP34 family phosphoprotein [unclassified Streptomyces]SMQ20440.1 Golgi phosphoprotein 3 (GPP34) [Streptomyces sp. Ag82_O1-12]SOD49292.1 Golgi phosphoprotein 3 (GPP34) [Streptomyces sp. Ag82_G6-1]